MRIPSLTWVVVAFALAVAGRACAANLVTGSSSGAASLSAGGNSFGPVISGNGQRIAFVSHAGNLVTNQTDPETLQVYVRSLVTDRTTLVSVGTNGRGANASSTAPVMTPGGQFIAFTSEATDLAAGDTNFARDVYVRDLASGTTRLVSADLTGRAPNDATVITAATHSGNPFLSADGRWVFFESYSSATNFTSAADTNATVDIFARDTLSNRTVLVSQSFVGPQTAERSSRLWGASADGARAVFISPAKDLVAGVTSLYEDVYVRDISSNTTFHASSSLGSEGISYQCVSAAISADGRFVAFVVFHGTVRLFLRDLETDVPLEIPANVAPDSIPLISADGRYVAYENGSNLFRFDRITGTNQLVSVALGGGLPAAGISSRPVMTPDGNGIVFVSNAADLTTNGGGGFQIYARDMAAGVTRLMSVATNGSPSSVEHELSTLSVADFLVVAFDSPASDLVAGDGNRASDVFIRDVAGGATHLASRREAALPRASGVAHSFVGNNSLSANGRFVVFTSFDNDLLPGDTNGYPDVFVRDFETGTVVTPGFSTNTARFPAISADGRQMVYLRRKPIYPFASEDAVFRFDRQSGTEEMITPWFLTSASVAGPALSEDGNLIAFRENGLLKLRDLTQATNEIIASAEPVNGRDAIFTPDGRFMLFASTFQLTTNAVSTSLKLYSWDRVLRVFRLLSYDGNYDLGFSRPLSVSNSRFVAFANFVGIYRVDLLTGSVVGFYGQVGNSPALNSDGTLVAFQDYGNQLILLDTITLGQRVLDRQGRFSVPQWSRDNRFLVYGKRSYAGEIPVYHYAFNVFARDRLRETTTLISPRASATDSNAAAWLPQASADGRTVVFHSAISDLATNDFNDKLDLFVARQGVDVDGDGMDDDWEVAYFGNLSRNGAGDFDGDGASDGQEFLAVTDPTNSGSIFRVSILMLVDSGSRLLSWTGHSNLSYRAEFKDDLGTNGWMTLATTFTWNGSTASCIDPYSATNGRRYYRAVRLP